MLELKYRAPRPPAFTVRRKTANGQISYCADMIHGVIGLDLAAERCIPHIAFLCSGQHVQFPAAEVIAIEITPEGTGHCNACDRQYESYIES